MNKYILKFLNNLLFLLELIKSNRFYLKSTYVVANVESHWAVCEL